MRSREIDLEFVNTRFDGRRDSEIELRHGLSFTDIPLDEDGDEMISCVPNGLKEQNLRQKADDDDSSENIIQRLSNIFAIEKAKEKLRSLTTNPDDMKVTRGFCGDIDMASAIYRYAP